MVTRLESGRIQLNAPGGVPMERVVPQQVDYMPAAREEARGAGMMADIIDRMSASIYGAAKEMAATEAVQYVATNPPDRAQFLIAAGFDPETGTFRGAPPPKKEGAKYNWTEFDKVYQKARDAQIASLIKQEGLHQIANLITRTDKEGVNALTSKDVETQIENMINGFEAAARKESPAAALEVRASLAAHGYTAIEKVRGLEAKAAKERQLIRLDQDFEDRLKILKDSLVQFPDNTQLYADVFARNLIEEAVKTNDRAIVADMRKRVNEAVANAKIDAVSTYVTNTEFAGNNLAAVRRLDKDDAGQLSPIWNSMNFSEKAKVRDGLRSVYADKVTAETRARDEEHRSNLSLVNQMTQRLIAADGNDREAESILLSISYRDPTAINPKDIALIKKQAADKQEPSYGVLTLMKENIFNDKYLNIEQMKAAARKMGVPEKFIYSDLQPFFISRKDKEQGLLYQGFNRAANMDAGSRNEKNVQRARQSIEQEVDERFQEQTSLPPEKRQTKSAILKDVQEERKKSQANQIIEMKLKSVNESYGKSSADAKTGIVFDINTNIDELADQARRGKNKLSDLDIQLLRSEYAIIKKQYQVLNPVRSQPGGR